MVAFPHKAIAYRRGIVSAVTAVVFLILASAGTNAAALYIKVGARTQAPPIGWAQFCDTYKGVCNTKPLPPLDVVLDNKAWNGLKQVNDWVNHTIKPETDMDHYGMIQWWRYPDDGAGACHSFALLKRRMLIEDGWPRQALLITIVHESDGEGHAVLTVKTDRGEFILDNLTDNILLWSKTPYRYYKRQSQDDPNTWVWLDDTRTNDATSAIRRRD